MHLTLGDHEATFKALKEVMKLVDCKSVLFQSYAERYCNAFIKEMKEGIPGSVLVRNHHY